MIALTLIVLVLWLAIAYWADTRRSSEARVPLRVRDDEIHHMRK